MVLKLEIVFIIDNMGDGKVKSIEGDKITLDFKEEILRTFSLRVLMENNLIILIK